MMTEPYSDEWLSGYLDGELTDEQRTAVELRLQNSPDDRRLLASLQQVSVSLRDLPFCELPDEFALQVMQQAERQMLLPAASGGATRPARTFRKWVLAGAPLVAAAAVVLLVVQLAPRQPEQRFERQSERRGEPGRATEIASASRRVAGSTGLAHERDDAAAGKSEAAIRVLGQRAIPARGDSAAIDHMVTAIREVSDSGMLPVVRVAVVDQMAGQKLVQWILEQQQIAQDAPSTLAEGTAPEAVPAESPRIERQVQREGLLVIAETEQILKALQTLFHQSATQSLEIIQPVDPGSLDERGRQQIVSWSRKRNAVARPEISDSSPAIAATPAARTSATSAETSDRLENSADKPATGSFRGVQVVVSVHNTRDQIPSRVAPGEAAASAPSVAHEKPDAGRATDSAVLKDHSLVRVLILVEQRAAEEPRPAAPAQPAKGDGAA